MATAPDASASYPEPEQNLQDAPIDANPGDVTVDTPEPEGERLGEAGNAYVGRTASDAVTTHPRVLDADRVLDDAEDEA